MNVPHKSFAVGILVVMSTVVWPVLRLEAQEGPPLPEPTRPPTPVPPAVVVPPPTAVPTPSVPESLDTVLSQRHSFRFVNEDIRVVLRGLARAYGFNITIAPEITGKVTADFQNVRIRDVIDNILKDYGYGYRESGDILRITTLEKLKIEDENEAIRKEAQAKRLEAEKKQAEAELAKEPVVIKVFRLKYVDATNVQAAIEPLLSPAGVNQPAGTAVVLETKQFTGFAFENVTTYSAARSAEETRDFVRSNTLIVKDKESVVAEIGKVIEQLDRKPYQIMIDAKLIEVPINQDFRLGLDWSGALNQLKIDFTDASIGLTKSYEKTSTYTGSVSRSSGNEWQNTNLASREISDGASTEHSLVNDSGINYTASNATGPYQINSNRQESVVSHSDTALTSSADSTTYFDNYINSIVDQVESIANAGNTASMVLSAADFSVLISALESDSDITILSNPRIIVHENYAANIFVGQRYPILSTEFDAAGGASAGAVGGTKVEEWREIGIALKVIPQLRKTASNSWAINMIVHPAVSNIEGYAIAYTPTGQVYQSTYPIISIREADTNVTIGDGDTIVIGGLVDSYTADEESKIPLLGDIPVLGYLFKEEHTATKKTNLLIFITARVVEESRLSAYEKLMLEKAPPESLEDVGYVSDDRVRPYLYRNVDEPDLEKAPAADEEGSGADAEETANPGSAETGRQTKARERVKR